MVNLFCGIRALAIFLGLVSAGAPAATPPAKAPATGEKQVVAQARNRALLIGVGRYQVSERLPDIPFCCSDVAALRQVLGRAGYVVVSVTDDPKGDPDRQPTRQEAVASALKAFVEDARGADVALVYFSCHGYLKGDTAYLALHDTDPESTDLPGLAVTDVRDIVERCGADNKVLVLDACRTQPDRADKSDAAKRPDLAEMLFRDAAGTRGSNLVTLASCKKGQRSYQFDARNSAYTRFLVQGLRGEADRSPADRTVTLHELMAYVTPALREWASVQKSRLAPGGLEQEPVVSMVEQADFVLGDLRTPPKAGRGPNLGLIAGGVAALGGIAVAIGGGGGGGGDSSSSGGTASSSSGGGSSQYGQITGYVFRTTSAHSQSPPAPPKSAARQDTPRLLLRSGGTSPAGATPAVGASITTTSGGSGTAGPNGYFSFSAPTGPCTLTASLSGYASVSCGVTVGAGAQSSVPDTGSDPIQPGSVAGKVTDASSGAAIAGATVKLRYASAAEVVTPSGADGTYRFVDVTPATGYTVTVTASGFVEGSRGGIQVQSGEQSVVDFALSVSGSLAGTVTDLLTGKAVSGATVALRPAAGGEVTWRTGDNGGYWFGGLSPDAGYALTVAATDYQPWTREGVEVKPGEQTIVNAPLVSTLYGAISGRITNSRDGAPVASATVTLSSPSWGTLGETATDASGVFLFGMLEPAADYALAATATGYRTGSRAGIAVVVGANTPGADIALVPVATTPPAAPTEFAGAALSSTSIRWTWKDNAADEQHYQVVRPNWGGLSGELSPDATSWEWAGLSPNTSYECFVRVVNEAGQADSASVTVYTLADVPTVLTVAHVGSRLVELTWDGGAARFQVERAPDDGGSPGEWSILADWDANVTGKSWLDTGLQAGTRYHYRVSALNGDRIPSAPAGPVAATTSSGSPGLDTSAPWPQGGGGSGRTGFANVTGPRANNLKWALAGSACGPVVTAAGAVRFWGSYYPQAVFDSGPLQPTVQWTADSPYGSSGSPPAAAADGLLYFAGGSLCALWPDGSAAWQDNVPSGSMAAPALSSTGTVYFGDTGNKKVYAVRDGILAWSQATAGTPGTPALSPAGMIYVVTQEADCLLWEFDPASTSANVLKRTAPTGAGTASDPVVGEDGTVYVTTRGAATQVVAYSPAAGAAPAVKWRSPALGGTTTWPEAAESFTAPVVTASGVYVGAGNRVHCLDPATGAVSSSFTLAGDYSFGPMVVDKEGTLYAGVRSQAGAKSAAAFRMGAGAPLWTYTHFPGGETWQGAPAFGADGTLYLGTTNRLLAFSAQSALKVNCTVSDASPGDGDTLTYTLSYRNDGAGTARGVALRCDLTSLETSNVNFVDADDTVQPDAARVLTWILGDLAAGATGSKQFRMQVNSAATNVALSTNGWLTSGETAEAWGSDATAVLNSAALSAGSVTPTTGSDYDSYTYQVAYTHRGNVAPSYVRLTVTRPDGSSETFDMAKSDTRDTTYSDGCVYERRFSVLTGGAGTYAYRFEASDGTRAAPPLSGSGPTATASAARIAFRSYRDDNYEVYVMGAGGAGQTRLTNNTAEDGGYVWSPDGSRISFQSYRDGNWEIYVMNADGTGQTNLTQNTADDRSSAWSPDGTKIAFTSKRDDSSGEVYVMNADGSGVTRLTTRPYVDDEAPTWSPAGNKIAWRGYTSGVGYGIWVMNADGSGQTEAVDVDGDSYPVWSPDGTKIAFHRSSTPYGIHTVNPDGTGLMRLTTTYQDAHPAWSPDGTTIAFRSVPEGHGCVYAVNANGSGVVGLTDPGYGGDDLPAWSPDGSRIAFHSSRDRDYEIYVMNADGTGQTRVTDGNAENSRPLWKPGATRAAMSRSAGSRCARLRAVCAGEAAEFLLGMPSAEPGAPGRTAHPARPLSPGTRGSEPPTPGPGASPGEHPGLPLRFERLSVTAGRGATRAWEFRLHSLPDRETLLTWPDLSGLGARGRVVLEDLDTNTRRNMRTSTSYVFRGESRRFRVTAEKRGAAALMVTDLALECTGRGNGRAVRVTLSAGAGIDLDVITPTGALLTEVLHGEVLPAGTSRVPLRMRLASGLYLLRVQATADDGTAVQSVRPVVVTR